MDDTFCAEEEIIFLTLFIAYGSMMNTDVDAERKPSSLTIDVEGLVEELKMKVTRFMKNQGEEDSEEEEGEDFITMEFGDHSSPLINQDGGENLAESPDHSSPLINQAGGEILAESPDHSSPLINPDHSSPLINPDHSSPLINQAGGEILAESPDHSSSLVIQAGGVAPYHPLHNPCAPRPTFLRYGKNSPGFSIHKLRPIVDIQRSEEESRAKAESEAEAEAETEADQGYNGEKSQVNEDYVNESHGPQLAQDSPSLEDQESKQPNDTTEPNPNSLLLLAHRINTSTVGFKSCRSVIRKMMLPLFMLLVLVTVTVTSGFDLLVLDNNYLGSSIVHHHSAHMNNPLPLTERVSLSQKMKGFFFLLQQSEEREKENRQTVRQSSTATLALVQEIRKVEQMQDEIGEDASRVFHLQELKQAEEREDNLATENGENAGLSWPDSGCNASQYLSQELKDDTKILLKSAIEPELKQCNELKDHTIEVDSSDFRTSLSEVNRQSHLAGNEMIKSDVWGHAHCLETFEEHHHGGLNRLQSKDSLSSKVVCQLQRDCDEIPRIAELKKNEEIRLPDRDCLPHSKSDGAVEVLAVAGCDVKKEILSTPSKGEKRTSGEMNSKINCSNGEVCQDEIGEDASRVLEIACLRLAQSGLNHDAAETIALLQTEIKEMHNLRCSNVGKDMGSADNVNLKSMGANLKEEISRLQAMGDEDLTGADSTIATLEETLNQVQKSIDNLVVPTPSRPSLRRPRQNLVRSPCSPRTRRTLAFENENTPPKNNIMTTPQGSQKSTPTKSEDGDGVSSREGTPSHRRSSSVNIKKMQNMFKTAAEENIQSIRAYVTELKERVAKLQYQKQLLVCQVLELEENADMEEGRSGEDEVEMDIPLQSPSTRRSFFKEQQRKLIELWDLCQVSIIHRTQFFLLFKGDETDQIYMEVELRRLTWMQNHFAELGNASPANTADDHVISLASSARALKRERELLAKRMRSRFTAEERELLFAKWEVPLESKQRKLQLVQKLWTNPHCMQHIQESAEIVARLVGFCEPGNISKEMFELNFAPPSEQKPWLWNPIAKILDL